mmetsp:Transcript_11853/g.24480  ORF Transcript_11853/g.24480 Transcript_11853/m.24480 type:complete len:182 (-) Transcript_11853:125-670(-)
MTPLHQQESVETRLKDQPFRISTRMRGDRLVSSKKDSQLLEDYRQRSSPFMKLPKLQMTGDYFSPGDSPSQSDKHGSALSLIDGALEVIDYGLINDFEDGWESDDDVMVVPMKLDNYVNKRSRISRADKRRKELLLDNASAINDALMAIQVNKRLGDLALASDEESLDAGDLDDSHKSYQL